MKLPATFLLRKATRTTIVAGLIATALSPLANAAFIYHDSATTDGGEFSTDFQIGKLKNGMHTSHLATESTASNGESYATENPAAGGFPVTLTLDFTSALDLTNFYLWNHSNNNGAGAPNNGVGAFKLTFFDGASGSGSQIGAVFNGSALAAPGTGSVDYAAQVFDFGFTYAGVRSIEMEITSKANGTNSGFVAIKELGFETIPEPGSTLLLSLGLGSFLLRRRR
jgi:hypothetical protein